MNGFYARVTQLLPRGVRARRLTRLFGVVVAVLLLFAIPHGARAGLFDPVYQFLSAFFYFLIEQFSKITVLLFGILVDVAQYNDFINAPAVVIGWRVLRDVANMFFILVLLVIAFGTAFRIQSYRYNALLRQVIIMAVLINFSKLITGFFIDFSQVIMLTFVNAFADTAAGNLTTALHLSDVVKLSQNVPSEQITSLSVAGTLLLGLIMVVAMTIVTFLYVVIFLGRIVFLWLLTILSPMAYLFNAFPPTKSYWSKWWRMFWQYAMVGPVLAFFLWLTLTVTAASDAVLIKTALTNTSTFDTGGGVVAAAISQVGSQAAILSFLVAIMLLVFSLKVASDFSVAGGAWAVKTGAAAQKTIGRIGTALPRGVANNYVAPLAMTAAGGLTGAIARSGIPLASTWAAKQNAGVAKTRKKWEDDKTKWMEDIKDPRIMAQFANISGARRRINPGADAERRKARKLSPSSITNFAEFEREIQDQDMDEFKQRSPRELRRIAQKYIDNGAGSLAVTAPEKAAWLIKDAAAGKRMASGFHDPQWTVDPSTGRPLFRSAVPTSSMQPQPDAGTARDYQTKLLSDVNEKKYADTERAIRQRYKGDADAFYASGEFGVGRANYLERTDYDAAARVQRAQTKMDEMTGIKTAKASGARGEAVNLAIDFADSAAAGLALGSAAGANLTGKQQLRAASALSEKYRAQEEEKEIARRRKTATDGVPVSRKAAAAAVKADAAFQQKLATEAGDFRTTLENAASINLINKGRVGRSARQTIRHEEAHNAVDTVSDEQRDAMWRQLEPERQQEVERYVRSNWANGQSMDLKEIQKEFFTEALASHGRGQQLGPLGLSKEQFAETQRAIDENFRGDADAFFASSAYERNQDRYLSSNAYDQAEAEHEIMQQLTSTVNLNRQEQSRNEVDQLPTEGLEQLYGPLAEDRRRIIAEYVRSTREGGGQFTNEDVMREFFSEALAAHRGGEKEGPLAFSRDEQELALLLHAAGKGKTPTFTPSTVRRAPTPVSASEFPRRAPPPPIAPPPAGARGVIAPPPSRVVERSFDAPISPLVVTNIINNTTVHSVADDLSKKLAGRISKQDLLIGLNQLENQIRRIANDQGLAEQEIASILSEINLIRGDVRSPSELPADQQQLEKNVEKFLEKFKGVDVVDDSSGRAPTA